MTLWFRWEKNFASRWNPVVYHGSKPTIPKHDAERLTAAIEVPASCIGADGEPMFGALQAAFPAPLSEPST